MDRSKEDYTRRSELYTDRRIYWSSQWRRKLPISERLYTSGNVTNEKFSDINGMSINFLLFEKNNPI